MNEEPPEVPSDEDENPFVSLGDLLSKGRSVAVLAAAIKKFGIYTTDRFGVFGKAVRKDKALAFEYLELYYKWETDRDPQTNHRLTQNPLSATAGDANPFSQSGWHKDDLPNFDRIEREQIEAHEIDFPQSPARKESWVNQNRSKPVSSRKIKSAFAMQSSTTGGKESDAWWGQRMRDAKDYDLVPCRASPGRARKPSFWYPDQLAGWLVDKNYMTEKQVAEVLRQHFPDCPYCSDVAERFASPA